MSIRHPGYYSSWLHVVADLTTSTNINLFDWIRNWTLTNYGYEWKGNEGGTTSKKLNAIITIPAGNTISSTNASIAAIFIDSRFRYYDRITLKIAGKVLGGYADYCFDQPNNQGIAALPLQTTDAPTGFASAKAAHGVTAKMIGAGGGGGGSNDKGAGGSGGGGGGGAFINGYFAAFPGSAVTVTVGAGGAGAVADSLCIVNGTAGTDTKVQFKTTSNSNATWTAGAGGRGGGGGGGSGGCVDFTYSGPGTAGAGGSAGTASAPGISGSTINGSAGGNGTSGGGDGADNTGGDGGDSGSFGQGDPSGTGAGGDGGDTGGTDGIDGKMAGGGGGGGGSADRSGGRRYNDGGNGANGFVKLRYHRPYLAGPGVKIANTFPGYIEINNQGGAIGGSRAIEGGPPVYSPVALQPPLLLDITSLPSTLC